MNGAAALSETDEATALQSRRRPAAAETGFSHTVERLPREGGEGVVAMGFAWKFALAGAALGAGTLVSAGPVGAAKRATFGSLSPVARAHDQRQSHPGIYRRWRPYRDVRPYYYRPYPDYGYGHSYPAYAYPSYSYPYHGPGWGWGGPGVTIGVGLGRW